MREILFRGFHPCDGPETIVVDGEKVKGRWVEGYYVERDNKSWIYPASNQMISKSLARELRPFHSAKSTQKIMKEVFPVLPSTVGQYSGLDDSDGRKVFEGDILKFRDESNDYEWTGLKDKNGKRIFEGDILSYNCGDGDDEPREVHFMNGRFVVQWAVRGDIDDKPYQTIRMAKVIGSIYDGEGRND